MIRVLLPLAAFFSAANSLSVEIAIVRLGAPYIGQSLLPWSAAIASVLLGLTIGHVLGGKAGGAKAGILPLRLWLGGAWLAASLATLAMPVLAGMIAALSADDQGFGLGTALALAALAFPPSMAAGFVAPILVRIAQTALKPHASAMIGTIYAASAAGSVLGTAAAGFLLLETIGAAGLARAVAASWLLLGILCLPLASLARWMRSGTPRCQPTAGSIALAAAAGVSVIVFAGSLFITDNPRGPCQMESRYTCIQLHDRPLADGGLLRFMILDEGVHSASDRDHPVRLHLGYAALTDRLAHTILSTSPAPRALVIGGGGATLPRAWAYATPPAHVTVAELDAEVARLAKEAMWAERPDYLTTIVGDGRAVLRSLPGADRFDVALMDAYRTRSVPPHLVSAEFGAQVAARLTPQGVYLSNIIDRTTTPLLALSVAKTLRKSFPAVDLWTTDEPGSQTTNVVVAAWKNPDHSLRPATLTVAVTVSEDGQTLKSQNVTWQRTDFDQAHQRWPSACAAVLTDDWAPVDRLLAGRSVCSASAETR